MGGFFCIVKIKKFFVNGGAICPPLFSPCIMRGKLRGFLILPNCISQLLPSTLYLATKISSEGVNLDKQAFNAS